LAARRAKKNLSKPLAPSKWFGGEHRSNHFHPATIGNWERRFSATVAKYNKTAGKKERNCNGRAAVSISEKRKKGEVRIPTLISCLPIRQKYTRRGTEKMTDRKQKKKIVGHQQLDLEDRMSEQKKEGNRDEIKTAKRTPPAL